MNIRVVVADDQPLLRAGIAALLAAQRGIDVVDKVCGEEAVKSAATHLPDVMLLDLPADGADGAEVIGQIVADGLRYCTERPVRVLAITDAYTPRGAWAALRAGAAGFLLKSRPPEVLLGAIRSVAEAGIWLDAVVLRDMLLELSSPPAGVASSSALVRHLTAREREVLALLAYGLGNSEIAERLFLSEATVRTHVGRILMKLHCRSRTQAVVLAYRSGLVRVTADEWALA